MHHKRPQAGRPKVRPLGGGESYSFCTLFLHGTSSFNVRPPKIESFFSILHFSKVSDFLQIERWNAGYENIKSGKTWGGTRPQPTLACRRVFESPKNTQNWRVLGRFSTFAPELSFLIQTCCFESFLNILCFQNEGIPIGPDSVLAKRTNMKKMRFSGGTRQKSGSKHRFWPRPPKIRGSDMSLFFVISGSYSGLNAGLPPNFRQTLT